jgi:hypothetical protein
MVYVYYNLRLLVRQIQKTLDVDAISLDGIDTSVEWRVESERPILESMLMVVEYPIYKNLLFGCLAKHVALQDASATGVHLIKYTPRSATGYKFSN